MNNFYFFYKQKDNHSLFKLIKITSIKNNINLKVVKLKKEDFVSKLATFIL